MLNLLFRIFLVVLGLVIIVWIIGSLFPRDYETTANVTIDAAPEQVFPFVNDLLRWQTWSPWNAHDNPSLTVRLGARTVGEGATQTWTEPRGEGKLWITLVEEPRSVRFKSRFANFPEMESEIRLAPEGTRTLVTWTSTGSLPGGPFYGWFGMAFQSAFRSEINKALGRLKSTVERNLSVQGEGAPDSPRQEAAPRG